MYSSKVFRDYVDEFTESVIPPAVKEKLCLFMLLKRRPSNSVDSLGIGDSTVPHLGILLGPFYQLPVDQVIPGIKREIRVQEKTILRGT